MSTAIGTRHVAALRLVRDVGLTGAVVVSWAAAGGILFGGVIPALGGVDPAIGLTPAFVRATAGFLLGALVGLVHGAALGVLGRRSWLTVDRALNTVGIASLYALPALATVWTTAAWMAVTPIFRDRQQLVGMVGGVLAWAIGLVVIGMALIHGVRALREAYRRWPERLPGTVFAAAAFVGLLVALTSPAPRVAGLPVRIDVAPAVLLAAVVSTWVTGPAVTVGLRLRVRFRPRVCLRIAGEGTTQRVWSIVAALFGTVFLAAVALPFHGAPYRVPTPLEGLPIVPALLRSGGEVILAGVAFRLFLVTGLLALLCRGRRADNLRAVLAVAGATVVETLVLTPGAVAVGLPGLGATFGYLLATAVVPGLVLGFLYLRAGWSLSLIAHMLAVVLIELAVGGVR